MSDPDFASPKSVTVVGGLGRMGELTLRLFREANLPVTSVDSKDGPIDWELVGRADVILLSIPISAMAAALEELGPHTRPDGLVADIASLKEEPVRLMLEHCRGEVIGSHPLFGPHVESLEKQLVFVWPARSTRWISWFRSFFQDRGASVVDMNPRDHDRLMATVQALRHMLIFIFGRGLMRMDFDMETELPIAGPWFSRLIEMLDNQTGENPQLYAELAFPNPHLDRAVESLSAAAEEVCSAYGARDRAALVRMINELSSFTPSNGSRKEPSH